MLNDVAAGKDDSVLVWSYKNFVDVNKHLCLGLHPAFPVNTEFNVYNILASNSALLKSTFKPTEKDGFLTADTELVKQAHFPDFMNPAATLAWAVGLEGLATQAVVGGYSVEYDGPYTKDCDGECPGKTPTPPSPPQMI